MPSRPSAGEAKDAARIRSCSLLALKTTGLPSLSSFLVSVPVLSEQRISIPAISSIEARRETMAFIRASTDAPTAIVTDRTAGKATGMAATVRIKAKEQGLDQRIAAI